MAIRTNAQPVEVLREHVTSFEAALQLALAKPDRRAVHQVRTFTRRIEAQFELLAMLAPGNPALAEAIQSADKLMTPLTTVRKAAGRVRDLDVQRDLVKTSVPEDAEAAVYEEATQLRKALKKLREAKAEALIDELGGHALKLGPKLEKLLERLESLGGLSLSPDDLTRRINGWYAERTAQAGGSQQDLHNIRKAAKLARYMAESAGARLVAEGFEQTQELGGEWHDALTLRQISREHLGRKSGLVAILKTRESQALDSYRKRLTETHAGTPLPA